MGATPFKALDWVSHEVITTDKLDAMQANSQWLIDNTPRSRFIPDVGTAKDSGLLIIAGRCYVPRNKYWSQGHGAVTFGTTFKPGTIVHVTTGVNSNQKKRVFCVMNGLGASTFPDYRGFDCYTYVLDISDRPKTVRGKVQKDVPDQYIFVNWIATGERNV
jgi:hypothetical protein